MTTNSPDDILQLHHLKEVSLVDLYYNVRRQGDTMIEMKDQLEELSNLSRAVSLLVHQVGELVKDSGRVDGLQDKVTQHQTLHWVTGAICTAVFPVLVIWNVQLNADLKSMQSDLDTTKEKIIALERATYTKSTVAYVIPEVIDTSSKQINF